jgi:mRNA interferase MazF
MKKGDIILIPFPFTNLSGRKLRPALVLAVSPADIIVAFITSQTAWKNLLILRSNQVRVPALKKLP